MAIKICTGDPRSGKSYYAVWHLTTKFFEFDKILNEYQPKILKDHSGKRTKFTIITNLENLKLPHIPLEKLLRDYKCIIENERGFRYDPGKLFNLPTMQKITAELGVLVFVIDEAHKLFPDKFSDEDCLNYFREHGHLGHEWYLITQYWPALSRFITGLAEYEIKVSGRSLSAMGERRYTFLKGGEKIGGKVLKPDPWIHSLYQSATQREIEKTLTPVRKIAVLTIVFVGLAGFMFYSFLNRFTSDTSEASAAATGASEVSPADLAPSVAGSGAQVSRHKKDQYTINDITNGSMVRVSVGKLIFNGHPYLIQWGDDLYRISDWAYPIEFDQINNVVYTYVPETVYDNLKFITSLDLSEKKKNDAAL